MLLYRIVCSSEVAGYCFGVPSMLLFLFVLGNGSNYHGVV